MLEAFRRQMEAEELWQNPDKGGVGKKIDRAGADTEPAVA
jgi:hypothetical protein